MNDFIPVASVDLGGNEEAYVVDAMRSTWISSSGKYLQRFEKEFAVFCGSNTALSVCNGTAALYLALLGMDLRPGDEVIVPSLTYVATANAVRYVGAEPVFVDVDPATWCMDPEKVEAAITRRTRGIIPVHLLGHPADMDEINRIADVNGLWVIEDAAEAVGARYKGKPVGSLSHAATFSFFGNKVLTSGEGGAVTLSNDRLATRLKALRGQGMDPSRRYYFPIVGHNFRLTNLACAILCAQLERSSKIIEARKAIYERYNTELAGIPGIGLQPIAKWAETSPWMFACTIDAKRFGCTRNELMSKLAESQIETRPMFISLHTLPPYREQSLRRNDHLPITAKISEAGLMLPTFNTLTSAMQDRVIRTIKEAHRLST
jgi:perosamine synthetase